MVVEALEVVVEALEEVMMTEIFNDKMEVQIRWKTARSGAAEGVEEGEGEEGEGVEHTEIEAALVMIPMAITGIEKRATEVEIIRTLPLPLLPGPLPLTSLPETLSITPTIITALHRRQPLRTLLLSLPLLLSLLPLPFLP